MAGLSASSSTAASSASQYGTNVPPISFPGVASGLDYNAIINQLVNATTIQNQPLQKQITSLNAANAELLKIQGLVATFQDSFTAVSDPSLFQAVAATSSAPTQATASGIAGQTAVPGTYQILATKLASATAIAADPAAGVAPSAVNLNTSTTALAGLPLAATPSNGGAATATLTVNGHRIAYDVNTTSFQTLAGQLKAADPNLTLAYNTTTGQVTLTSANGEPLTLGSATDTGNVLHALGLDTAPVTTSGTGATAAQSVTSSGSVVGINPYQTLSQAGNAGFATAVTSGTFTINGVAFTVNAATQSLQNVISAINASTAGVTATFDANADRLVLTSKTTGPAGITLGGSTDTSNLLKAAGLTTAGATTSVGAAGSVQYVDPSGTTRTVYTPSNDVTTVIPGVDLKLLQTGGAFTVTVAQDASKGETALGTFVTAYNALIDELNTATAAPVVGSSTNQTTGQQQGQQLTTGGVLYGNQGVSDLRDRLVNLVSSLQTGGSTSYNSLASVGLALDSSFSVSTASSSSSSGATANAANQTSVTTKTYAGTSGRLAPLDTAKFEAALKANAPAVAALFTTTSSVVGTLGAYLTQVGGLPTQLKSGLAGSIPRISLIDSLTRQTQDEISSLQQRIAIITDQANLQADMLRREFSNTELLVSQYNSLQSAVSSLAKNG